MELPNLLDFSLAVPYYFYRDSCQPSIKGISEEAIDKGAKSQRTHKWGARSMPIQNDDDLFTRIESIIIKVTLLVLLLINVLKFLWHEISSFFF
jgi:hypothetical protein